jgi:hypothetical protein
MRFTILTIFIFSVLAECLSSCWTFVGYGVGALADNGSAHDTVPIFRNISSYTGQAAYIQYHDSSTRLVTFEDYSDEPERSYRNDYDRYLKSDPSNPAAINFGDSIFTDGWMDKGVFEGYYPEGILLHREKLRFSYFKTMILPKRFSRIELQKLYESNSIPIRGFLNFQDKDSDITLTNRDFKNVFILPHNAPGRWIGLGIGAALDAAVIIWIAYWNSPAHGGQGSFANTHYVGGRP